MRTIYVSDSLQTYSYQITADEGALKTEFTPDLTPAEMLRLGVFGGHYFEGESDEFPAEWFKDARISDTHDANMNYFAIEASSSREEWERKGWINDQDPRGWFQWYCRYYLGRRSEDDQRQIKRWRQMTRHVAQVKAHCQVGDELCRRRQRQALMHWAYDSRKI